MNKDIYVINIQSATEVELRHSEGKSASGGRHCILKGCINVYARGKNEILF